MESDRQRIEQDLRGQLAGEVLCDPVTLALYAADASIYEYAPLAVVRPRSTADVATTLRYAHQHAIPVHARGGGSGLAGGALGSGLVIDFSRYMRRILKVEEDRVRVQAGVVHAQLNRHLASRGRIFGPNPATSEVTTLGGVLAVDGGGSHWPWCRSARDHVLSLKVVLADGEVIEASSHDPQEMTNEDSPRLRELVRSLSELADRHREVIQSHQVATCVNSSGYAMRHALTQPVELAKMLVGSEGTLGLIVEAQLQTLPLPVAEGRVLLMFESLDKAVRCISEIAPLKPAACDLMDRRHLSVAREADVRYDLMIPAAAEAVLLVEFFGQDPPSVQQQVEQVIRRTQDDLGLSAGYYVGEELEDQQLLQQLPRRFTETLHGMKGRRRATPCIEDIAVPPEALPVFVRHLQDTLKQRQITASLISHALQGQLHLRPLLDLRNAEDVRRMETLASEVYEKVWLLGGTIAGEHGDGLSRTPFLRRQHGPLLNVFREVKRTFDPQGILNPGKVLPTPGERMTQGIRRAAVPTGDPPPVIDLKLRWPPEQVALAAWSCNGCAACRTQAPDVRMCPVFRYAPSEEASPRAKANLLRNVLNGKLPVETLATERAREVADLCVHCCQCREECPAQVDIPRLMVEAKAAHVAENGLGPRRWAFSRLDQISQWASRVPWLVNFALGNRRIRWLLGRTMGLAPGRKLPRISQRPFLRSTARLWQKPIVGTVEKVVYFVDTYANFYDQPLNQALLKVLRHNQVGVVIPAGQLQSGMALFTQGEVDAARKIAERNVLLLAEYARQGYKIITTEPSAALALTKEYPYLLGDEDDVQLVAENTMEACHYLWKLHQRGGLKLDLAPIARRVAYHVPCHVRALGAGAPAGNLLRLIPLLRLNQLEKGCSGMAGLYGMQKENYRRSLRAGLPLLSELRTGKYDLSVSECSTCGIQMRQANAKAVLHPIQLLAASYGLLPEWAGDLMSQGVSELSSS